MSDFPADLRTMQRETRRELARVELLVQQLGRRAADENQQNPRLALTIADPNATPTYPVEGGGANVFPIVFLDGGFPLAAGAQTPVYDPDRDVPQTHVCCISGEYIPEGTVIQVWQDRGSDDDNPGEWWTPWSTDEPIVYFELRADKMLTTPQPVSAEILEFNGAAWVASGELINLYDDYYPAPGFFTGKANIDRGWAKLRKRAADPQDPDDYELIWMSGPAHVVRFTLSADRTSGAPAELLNATINEYFLYGNDRLQVTQVYFEADVYPRAFNGAIGYALYNDRDRRYEVIVCDQIAIYGTAVLSGDTCGSSAAVEEAFPASFWPHSTLHSSLQGGGGTILNICGHCGQAGDLVQFRWIDYLEEYSIDDIEKHNLYVVIAQRIVVTEGASGQDPTCVTQHLMQPICVELCQDPEWIDVDHCCCDPASLTPTPEGECDCLCETYAFTLSGISDASFNDDWLMAVVTISATWTQSQNDAQATLECQPGYYVLTLRKGPSITQTTYRLPVSSWNCTGANVMTFYNSLGTVTGWPATITVTCDD